MKFTFKSEPEKHEEYHNTTVEVSVNTESLEDIVPAFSNFLKASGFYYTSLDSFLDDSSDSFEETNIHSKNFLIEEGSGEMGDWGDLDASKKD